MKFDVIFNSVVEEVFYEISLCDEHREVMYWSLFKEWAGDASYDDLLASAQGHFDYLANNGEL